MVVFPVAKFIYQSIIQLGGLPSKQLQQKYIVSTLEQKIINVEDWKRVNPNEYQVYVIFLMQLQTRN
jgi:hypothetical protein